VREGKRQRKIARAPSGRPPTEGNELGLVPGPATYIPACWKVKTPLSSYTNSDSCYVRNVFTGPLGARGCWVSLRATRASPQGELSLSLDLSLTGQDASQKIFAVLRPAGTAIAVSRRLFLVILLRLARRWEDVRRRRLLLLRRGAAGLDLLHSHRPARKSCVLHP